MANNYHLISVSGQENMRKSDKTPADYLPSNQAFICTYLNNWLKVKATWRLVMLPEEAEAIESAMTKHGCEQQEMVLSEKEMRRQRKEIAQISNICGY